MIVAIHTQSATPVQIVESYYGMFLVEPLDGKWHQFYAGYYGPSAYVRPETLMNVTVIKSDADPEESAPLCWEDTQAELILSDVLLK